MSETRVPLELVNLHNDGFHLLVEVVVFGQSFHVVLDTGASKTVFDRTFIEKHMKNTELLSSELLSTGLGTSNMESHTILLPVLKIGKFKLKNFEVAVLDLSMISQAYSNLNLPPVIGVLGGDILMPYQAIINYKKLHLKLFR
jgi:predicted aspartyl protease